MAGYENRQEVKHVGKQRRWVGKMKWVSRRVERWVVRGAHRQVSMVGR